MPELIIGISGANSNLGKLIFEFLQQQIDSIKLMLLSSNPKKDQRIFDLEGEIDYDSVEKCDVLIHCARPLKATPEKTLKEIEILERISSVYTKIVNISSVSGFLDVRSNYGMHKRGIHQWIEERGEINLVSGLIFGEQFKGQISQMARILRNLPIRPQFRDEYELYITPVQQILVSIREILEKQSFESKFLLGKNSYTTNQLLRDISREEVINLRLKGEEIRLLLKLLPSNRYFSADSFLGFIGNYSELGLIERNYLPDTIIAAEWASYTASLGN